MTSPDISENNNIFLGFAQAESSKGSDQAHVILNLLDYYEVVAQMLPSVVKLLAHTGAFSGAISVLIRALYIFILWILFRHHICEVHISHLWKNSLAKYRRPKEGSLCPSAESKAFHQA